MSKGGEAEASSSSPPGGSSSGGANDSLYMDAEELELLHRFATDNPNLTTFKETDGRVRTLEERFPEGELEKIIHHATQLMHKRRETLTTDERVQTIPVHPTVPSILELRELRNAIVESSSQYATHEPFVNLADILAKEVALSEEPRSSIPYTLQSMVTFFKNEVDLLPRKIVRYLQRFEVLTREDHDTAMVYRKALTDRLQRVECQYSFARTALDNVSTYLDIYTSNVRNGANGRSGTEETADDMKYSNQSSTARIADEINPLYLRYMIADLAFQYRATRRIERFTSRSQLIPNYKRYELYSAAVSHLIGGFPATGAEVSAAVPLLAKDETAISDQLDHLCSCFRLPHVDSGDLQQFAYHTNRKYTVVFNSQIADWTFDEDHLGFQKDAKDSTAADPSQPQPAAAAAKGGKGGKSASGASIAENPTILRQSKWQAHCGIDATVPAWQSSQELFFSAINLQSEAGRQVAAEVEYLRESNLQVSVERWKHRGESFLKRFSARNRPGAFVNAFSGDQDADSVGEGGGRGGEAAMSTKGSVTNNPVLQKYLAIQQLRFIRTREFRRKLLDSLNYFASILRMIALDSTVATTLSHTVTGVAAIVASPITCDESIENRRRLEETTIKVDDPLRGVHCESFATHMLKLQDGITTDINVEEHTAKAHHDPTPAAKRKSVGGAQLPSSADDGDHGGKGKQAPGARPSRTSDTFGHMDSYELRDGKLFVRRSADGSAIMDQWALEELERLEQWLQRVGTFYVAKYNDETYPDAARDRPGSPSATSMDPAGTTTVDYNVVVEDMYESESWFSEGKVKVLNGYLEAYLHAVDKTQMHDLAKVMISLIKQRPHLDTGDSYFTSAYTREVVNLELQYSLLREIVQNQITDERRILSVSSAPTQGVPLAPVESMARSSSLKPGSAQAAAATAAGQNAPTLGGVKMKASDATEFIGSAQRSFQSSAVDPKAFGQPEESINDPKLFMSLFPGSSIVNVLDLHRSLQLIAHIPSIVQRGVDQVSERFQLRGHPSALQVLEREVLQEMLVQWRLLGEEDKLSRQLQQSQVTDVDADVTSNTSAIHDIRQIDTIIDSLLAEEDISSRRKANLTGGGHGASASELNPAAPSVNGLGPSRQLPPIPPRCQYYIAVFELFHVRSAILTALYETEILYSIHRRQGKIMGVTVKKSQLGPIDFETRRTFAEVDDLEALKDTSNPLEEILSIKTEMLSSLSIAEFDQQMANFDLQSIDGVRRLISHGGEDFRRALMVQVTTKNILIAVTMCNMVAIDVYFEGVFKQQYDRALKQMINYRYPNVQGQAMVRCRMEQWVAVSSMTDHSAVDANSGTQTTIDRTQLAKYFISINYIKSVFRKSLLNEMNNRTTNIMSSKKPETLRKVLKDLKNTLVKEYCVAITMATYQLAVKYHCCALSIKIRALMMPHHSALNFFVMGAMNDVIRPAPRGAAASGESRRAATCMITRSGRMDEARYIPNVLQILALDYQSKDAARATTAAPTGSGAAQPGAAAVAQPTASSSSVVLVNLSASTNYLRANILLSLTARVLHQWLAIMSLLRSTSLVAPSVRSTGMLDKEDAERARQIHIMETWKSELMQIMNEMDTMRDPNDTISVIEYLEGKHSVLFLKIMGGLTNAKSYLERYNHKASVKKFEEMIYRFDCTSRRVHAFPHSPFPRMLYPGVNEYIKAADLQSADEKLKVSVLYGPLCAVKKILDGVALAADFDQSLHELENVPPGSLSLHRDEFHFYGELARNNLPFVGAEVPDVHVPLAFVDMTLTADERNLLGQELSKVDQLVDEARDESENLIPVTLPRRQIGASSNDAKTSATGAPLVAHFELMLYTTKRDRLRDLFMSLHTMSLRGGWQRQTKAQKAASSQGGKGSSSDGSDGQAVGLNANTNIAVLLDDLYSRAILSRGRVVCEKEAADKNDNRFRRKQKGNEKEVARRQLQLLVMEINKLLISKYRVEAEVVTKELEDAAAAHDQLNAISDLPATSQSASVSLANATPSLSFKTSLFSDFVRLVMARAMCTRGEGERLATFHVPESSLALAMDTVGLRMQEWQNDITAATANVSENIIHTLHQKVIQLERQLNHVKYQKDVESKAVERRTTAAIADKKYELLFANGVLEKQLNSLRQRLSESEQRLRDSVRVEYQERLSHLESELMLSEQRFHAFKKKTFRDVQASLEEIKRGAMLAVGKMENAPLHMKRQALRIAISDDELNTLKEQNAELKQAILKTKLWYEIKNMRLKAAFEKKLKDATSSIEESRTQFWENREATEKEIKNLKAQLSSVQYQLSQAEIEIEMLRKDLQVQLSNKKDLVSWKLQNAKAVEELQKKLRKYEKWSALDLDIIVADYEKRQMQQQHDDGENNTGGGASPKRSSGSGAQRSAQSAGATNSAQQGAAGPSQDEHKRLLEKLDREKRLKEQAFAKIDELRSADSNNTEALVWQRKYFEAATELQKNIRELEATRAFLAANGLSLPQQQSVAEKPRGSSALKSSAPSSAATPGPSFELRPATSATSVRPPSSAISSNNSSKGVPPASRLGSRK